MDSWVLCSRGPPPEFAADAGAREPSIFASITSRDVPAVTRTLARRAAENGSEEFVQTAMCAAVLVLDVDLVKAMLQVPGVTDHVRRDDKGALDQTLLHCACSAGLWADSMSGSLLFRVLNGEKSLVDSALAYGGTEVGRRLLARQGDEATDLLGARAIREALSAAGAAVVGLLMDAGVPVDVQRQAAICNSVGV